MQANQTPTLVPLAFAAGGAFNTIPEASQIGTNPGGASLVDGFPPLTRTPIAAGGIPPSGLDMNGVLNLITQSIRWAHGGGRYAYNATFAADVNVGGYPSGSILMSADGQGSWLSTADNNTDNPDAGPGTKWVPSQAYGFSSVGGLTNANVTLTPAQAMKMRINLFGTLTGNVQIIFPTWTREWTVVNSTTGAFTVTAKTASGSGIVLPAGPSRIVGDGTNIVQPAENIAPATQSSQALTAGQVGAIGGQGSLPINTSGKVNGVNAANLLFNGSGEFGVAGGWGGGFVNAYNGGSGDGTYLSNPAVINSNSYVGSSPIAIAAGIQLTLSGEIYAAGVTSGIAWFRLVYLNSSSGVISTSANITATNGTGWTFASSSFTTPANTAFVYVQLGVEAPGPNVSSGGVAWRRLKLERGTAPSIYSQEASVAAVPVMHGIARFTSSGTFTVPTGVTTIYVSGCAGGGGGGAGAGNNNGQSSLVGGGGGGGGGAGQSVLKQSFSVTSGATITVTIGAAGTAGAGGVVGAGGAGGAGGNTTLTGGASLTLTGGTGGSGGAAVVSNAIGQGGGGGSGGAGFPNGSAGGDGNYAGLGGAGASSPFGGGGGSGRAATNTSAYQVGSAAGGYGAGGGGGGAGYGQASTAVTGGAGAVGTAGLIVFEW